MFLPGALTLCFPLWEALASTEWSTDELLGWPINLYLFCSSHFGSREDTQEDKTLSLTTHSL